MAVSGLVSTHARISEPHKGMWVLAPDGSYEIVEGAFGRLEMSPAGDHFVSTRDTLVNGRRESLPSIIVLDLDGRVLAEFGEGDFPVWTHGQPQS